jgi:hypothetical protein
MKRYRELAAWWPLFSPPGEDYAEEADTTYTVDYAILLRDETGAVRVAHDRHVEGLFPRATWRKRLEDAGFEVTVVADAWGRDLFVGRRRSQEAE